MRRVLSLAFLLILFAWPAHAQMGKAITVTAGTPEDKALNSIAAATDPAQKIQLLDQFMKDFGGNPDLALIANIQYTTAYLDLKDYPKAIAAGDKALAADPDNFSTAVNLVRAAAGLPDAARAFDYADKASAIVARYKASPAPANTPADQWKQQQEDTIKNAESDFAEVQYAVFSSTMQVKDGAARAALLERFLKTYPDSTYATGAHEALPFAYQQAKDGPNMLAAANAVLAKDPSNAATLLLLADYYSEKGQHLDDAAADAQKALDSLAAAKKPDNTSQTDWDKQVSLQKGIAYSVLGQIDVIRGKNAQAVASFKQANPLLESSNYYYGRNLYRLGFTLAKMQQYPEAQKYLQDAINVDSPYRGLAQQTLTKIGGAPAPRHKSSHP